MSTHLATANEGSEYAETLYYLHIHDGKGNHADGETYSIVHACEECVDSYVKDNPGICEQIATSNDMSMHDDACDGCGYTLAPREGEE